jgi:leader peptidase (prepilin peptidase) / N-methyltransferase
MILLISLYAGIIGACLGSFLDVLASRLPRGESVVFGRSHCDHCNRVLLWYELIPLVSFFLQRGKCRTCHTRLSFEYPMMELVTATMYGVITWNVFAQQPLLWISSIVVSSALLVIAVADLNYFIIPDSMIVVACIGALVSLAGQPFSILLEHIATGIGSFLFFYLLWFGTKKRGMGFGDVKLAFFIGFFLGFPTIITALYLAFLTGAALGIILIIGKQKTLKSRLPFGPFLILGLLGSYFISIPNLIGL